MTMESSSIFCVTVLLVLCNINPHLVLGDERFEEMFTQLVEDLVDITAERNESLLPQLPGYECFIRKPLGRPALGRRLLFPCDNTAPSDEIPTSVHRLRPADIKVVGAMGDSISAANGADACFLPELLVQYRGLTFSHGGDETFETNPTLANILRKFNPYLKGYGVAIGQWDTIEAGMNVGYPGDKANDMPHQAEWLVQKMKSDPSIDFENDWKVVTIFIGGNDLCAWCNNIDYYSADNFAQYIHEALMILHDEMPRTIVNVVGILQIYQVDILRAPICNIFHSTLCPCGMFLTEEELSEFEATNKKYQVMVEEDIMSGQYDDKHDFTVVLQPFFHNTSVPFTESGDPDFSYFAPDCFHFSAKGHAQSGLELWNNMMQPVGNKSIAWNTGDISISCPNEDFPYIYTALNSIPGYLDRTEAPPTTASSHSTKTSPLAISSVLLMISLSSIINYAA